MTGIIRLFSKLWNSEKEISESASYIGEVFDDNSEGQLFFDTVISRFENYDISNRAHQNKYFSTDIDYIIECALTSLTSSEHSERLSKQIDAFFYIYRRVVEYNSYHKKSDSQLKEFQEKLLQESGNAFKSTKGSKPCLSITNKDLIERMNIQQHLAAITEIKDIEKLFTFFALCNLSFQSSLLVYGDIRLQWINILSKIRQWKISLVSFISHYIEYKLVFERFPFDIPALIHLIRVIHHSKSTDVSPFDIFHSILNELNLDHKEFFNLFLTTFGEGVKNKRYKEPHICQLLRLLTEREDLLSMYLSTYASHVSIYDLWDMFLYLSTAGEINQTMEKQLVLILNQRIEKVSVVAFKANYKLADTCLKEIKDENHPTFIRIVDTVLYTFLNKQLNDDQYSWKFTLYDLQDLLGITLRFLSTIDLQQQSCLLIIQHLFKLDKNVTTKFTRIKDLFKRLNDLDQNLCERNDPACIIRDEWLNDYSFYIPQDWLTLTKNDYQTLRAIHHNNRWSIHIWSRLIILSLSKLEANKWNETISQLNHWMISVKHDIFEVNDTLTIIFVKNIFDIVISKHTKSVLFASNIESILNYILHASQDKHYLIDIKQVDDFIQNVHHSIKDILSLNSKFSLLEFLIVNL
ncbi:unnamed protein product [Rotaria socialis]|uniref:Uncharacterized protein n=1 Tax=Rotaria socialis TaxID=392032 RepID=A0A818W2T3_9BILA|nr:unnamed protein product [Rotaria socialis]CAF3264846.1 unnamed protein product [Rotaria socialis]CAF3718848.1 unnamed protein product [Rotaria socialis]CAF4157192.1 unnamed protein product [Rotaria socialis]CAF4298730.1 unnamed protein product [Rotaria socialis]